MIEDKELDLKVAENPEEAAWETLRKEKEEAIATFKRTIELNKVIIKFCKKKLKKWKKETPEMVG